MVDVLNSLIQGNSYHIKVETILSEASMRNVQRPVERRRAKWPETGVTVSQQ